jgi:hypothetical protein
MSKINRPNLHERAVPLSGGLALGILLVGLVTQPVLAQTTTPYRGTTTYSSARYAHPTSVDVVEAEEYGQETTYRERELPIWSIGYSLGLGVGDLHDFTGNTSFRGFEATLLWPAYQSLFLGLGFGYNGFYERKPRETRQLGDNAAVTARLYNYVDAWPLSFIGRYVFLQPQSSVRPYAGVRVGVTLMDTTTLITDRSFNDSSAGFLLAPEVGVLAHLSRAFMAVLNYSFNFSTASPQGGDSLSYNNLMVGFALQP